MRRKVTAICSAALLLIICTATTAYITTVGRARNTVSSGNIKAAITVNGAVSEGKGCIEAFDIVPGGKTDSRVAVKNIGYGACRIRARIIKTVEDGNKNTLDTDIMRTTTDNDKWVLRDGYYYYTDTVKSGDSTKPLFTSVFFDTAMGNGYENGKAHISVVIEAVQADNNGSSVYNAKGWPSTEGVN